MFGICTLSVISCRKEPSHKSEMVTQLLFGECVKLLETKENWSLVKLLYDNYECWIESKQLFLFDEKEIKQYSNSSLSADLIQLLNNTSAQQLIPIVMGSSLPHLIQKGFTIGKTNYEYDGAISEIQKNKKQLRSSIIETAYLYLNSPYHWGGRTPLGIDCSGLTQMVYKLNSIAILRDAYQQSGQGTMLSFLEEAEAGDLAFFDNEEGYITHVGIILPDFNIIHASGKVRIDRLDHQGIFNSELNKYTHNLRIIKNYID